MEVQEAGLPRHRTLKGARTRARDAGNCRAEAGGDRCGDGQFPGRWGHCMDRREPVGALSRD